MASTSSCVIEANPDITGVGVRISIYALSLGAPLLSCLIPSKDLRQSIETSLGITGFALLLTAFVFAGQHKLDLFHSICLFHLIGLVGLTIKPANVEFKKRLHKYIIYGAFYGGLLGFFVFMIYVFAVAPRFGTNPECNHTIIFVIFGINIQATNLVFRSYMIATTLLFLARVLVVGWLSSHMSSDLDEDEEDEEEQAISKVLSESAGRIYLIVMIELLLKRNVIGPGEGDWGFGQILSMMMLVGPMFQFIIELGQESGSQFQSLEVLLAGSGTILIDIAIISLDFAFAATAGAAAAATGAHVNGSRVTAEIVRFGALGAVIASGLLGFSTVAAGYHFLPSLEPAKSAHVMQFVSTVGVTVYGVAFIVVLAIGQRVLDEVPNAMLIASFAAAFPLTVGSIQPLSILNINGLPVTAIFDTLGAYVFVRVSQDHGFHVCSGKAAGAAGAVYGCILFVLRSPYNVLMKMIFM